MIEQEVRQFGIETRVHLLGNRTDVPEILGASDVFALASDWEGNPLSVMEAMAAGKPVVATAVGGVPDLVEDGWTGSLAPRGDADALAGAITGMIERPEYRLAMGLQGAEKALEHFDVSSMSHSYERLYDQLALG
jgi:glycosyltransferase involved in cell wall biosynthesis